MRATVLVRLGLTLAVLATSLVAYALGLHWAAWIALLATAPLIVFAYLAPWPFGRRTSRWPSLAVGAAVLAAVLVASLRNTL